MMGGKNLPNEAAKVGFLDEESSGCKKKGDNRR
jgi:hypothetical protein